MRTNKMFSILLSFVMLITSISGLVTAYADSGTVDNGVICITDFDSGMKRYVYYPEEMKSNSQKYPVIVWANGTGCQPSLYADLFKGLVKQGFVLVASDETMAADGKDQISGLDYIIKKSKTSGYDLYNRVDTTRVTAMGHSQGGRSAVNAASADRRFCCVISLAGSNYQDEAKLLKAPALFFTGTNDSIVSSSKWVKPAYDVCKGAAVYASLVDARHTTCCSEPDKYIGYCVSWMRAWNYNDFNALSVFKTGGVLANDSAWVDVVNKNLTNNISGTIVFSPSESAYNGKVKKPAVIVKDYRDAVISSDNYTVSYAKGFKNIGKYKVTVNYRNNYTGSASAYFCIVPKNTSINKLVSSNGNIKITVNKCDSQVSGYQIQYSTDSKFLKSKIVTVNNKKSLSKSISKLQKGKKYYVRIRTYKSVGKTKYYSSWSKSKAVTIKK